MTSRNDNGQSKTRFFTKNTDPKDGFNHGYFAQSFISLILEHPREDLPLVVGIFGPWGSGKTHFMRIMSQDERLKLKDESVKLMWFDPWMYERRQDVGLELIYRILAEVRARDKRLRRRAANVAKAFAKSLGKSALSTLDHFNPIPLQVGNAIATSLRVALTAEISYQPAVDSAIEQINKLVREWVGDHGRAVIFIDDLDRCLPDQMLRLLEALQLFLAKVPCVFVLGVDKTAIEAAVDQRYGQELVNGRNYVDKIIDVPFSLLPVRREIFEQRYDDEIKELKLNRDRSRNIMSKGLQQNPRFYERLFNHFRVIIRFGAFVEEDYWDVALILSIIKIRFPDLYDLAAYQLDNFKLYAELAASDNPQDAIEERLKTEGAGLFIPYISPVHPARDFLKSLERDTRVLLQKSIILQEVMLLDD